MSILGLLNQTLTLASISSYDADGEASFATGASVSCRFEAKTKRILLPNGDVLTIDGTVIVPSDTTIATDDKVTYDSEDYKVVDIFEVPGGAGNTHHKEVRVVKWPSS